MTPNERDELVEMIAQAVIERIEARERMNALTQRVLARLRELEGGGPVEKEIKNDA